MRKGWKTKIVQVYLEKFLFTKIKFIKSKKIKGNINKDKQKSLRISEKRRLSKKSVQKCKKTWISKMRLHNLKNKEKNT